ncbi:MAG: glucose-1-phosphate thymidylyltransferase RfbA [Gemmatimonadota bacterium]|jgi:glucose-1-phosphate thymidylyltransferase|nr:glucose-1-phosphate thymidylyltransferase RfbA [Gemmatimonadota bacterium]
MRAILLAGGAGTRLHPLTLAVSKQLMPVYNKPMVYYPLSTVMQAGLRDVLIVTTPEEGPRFRALLGTGAQWGMAFTYAEQPSPDGLAQAFLIGAAFLQGGPACLVLGDNLFHGTELAALTRACVADPAGATIFGTVVAHPERYGVLALDAAGRVTAIVEKPETPPSHFAVPGLYFYDDTVVTRAHALRPSARGELEITDLHAGYLRDGRLTAHRLGAATTWMDTGTHQSLLEAANFIEAIETRTGLLVGSPEETAFRQGWIDAAQLEALAAPLAKSPYGERLLTLARTGR